MRFFKRIIEFLGLSKDDAHDDSRDGAGDESDGQSPPPHFHVKETGLPRRGFGVPAQVVVDRPQVGPVLAPSTSSDGGVQGLGWYAKRLRIDEDGDVADKFLDEVSSEMPADHHKATPKFKVKHNVRPVKLKKQILSPDGKVLHCVEHQGRLQLV